MQQLSTTFSDLVLSLTSFGTAYFLLQANNLACAGFCVMGIAAGFGAYRFSLSAPSGAVVQVHENLAWLATVLGTSLLACGFHRQHQNSIMSSLHMGSALTFIGLSIATDILTPQTGARLADGISTFAVVSMGVFSILHANPFGFLAVVLYAIAGVVGTTGHLVSIRRVDWFHYFLAFANVVFLRSFTYNPASL